MAVAMNPQLRCLPFLVLLLFAAIAHASMAGDASQAQAAALRRQPPLRYLAGTVIVKLKESTPNRRGPIAFGVPALDAVLKPTGVTGRRTMFPLAPYPENHTFGLNLDGAMHGFDRVYVVSFSLPYDARDIANQLVATGLVDYAEPYFIFQTTYSPNDPLLAQQDWLNVIQAPQAWDVTKGDSTIAIAIIDTGVDWTHEDILPNIMINPGEDGLDGQGKSKRTNGVDDDNNGMVDDVHGWDFVGAVNVNQAQSGNFRPDNDPSPTPSSTPGYEGYHGTLVAGCASARADNAKGVAGVGFRTRIIPVKCTGDTAATGSVLAGYDGIRYAADAGARIINCSWGGSTQQSQVQALQDVVDYAYSKRALVVAAAGNFGTNNDLAPSYPANLRHVLSVGATTSRDSAAGFSQYGVSVGVWAPGVAIYTTTPGGGYGATINGGSIDGTSFSSPITSGIIALILARHPDWTPDQAAMQIRVTGDRVKVRSSDLGPYFYRRANAFRAVSLNATLAEGDPTGIPGVAVEGYTINGKALDTIRDLDQSVTVRLTLRNYLSPVTGLSIIPLPNQALTLDAIATVDALGTLQTTTKDLQVKLRKNSGILYSEGNLQLVLKLSSGLYEDYIAVLIPVRLPGWHLQYDPLAGGGIPIYSGSGVSAVTTKLAWALTNAQTSSTTSVPLFSRVTDGENWSRLQQVPGNEALYCIHARDGQRAFAGSGPSSGQAKIFRTANAGNSWQTTSVASITPFVNAVHFFDDQNGVFVGDPLGGFWGIGTTSDGGVTWQPITTRLQATNSTEAGWNNSFAASGDNLWFGTNNSRIYRSNDRGRTWAVAQTPSVNCFFLAFANANDGMATFSPLQSGTGSYAICASRDGGRSWQLVTPPFSGAQASGVSFVPGTTRAFVATQNGMYETNDFGATWKQMAVPAIVYQSVALSTAAGVNGALGSFGNNVYGQLINYQETGSAGVEHSGSIGSGSVMMYQAVPNPCTSQTVVPFQLATTSTVHLVLYDALGLEVARHDLGKLTAGAHQATIAVDALPSGNYFLRIEAGDQSAIGRLVVAR